MNFTQPNQKVSNAEKQKASWYIPNAEAIIKFAIDNGGNKELTRSFLNAANDIVDESQFKHILRQYNVRGLDPEAILGKIRNVGFITPIKEKYMGEFINMFANYQVYNNDPETVLARNKAIRDKVSQILVQRIINELNAEGFDTNQESQEVPDMETEIAKVSENWVDDLAIKTQDQLELLNSVIDAKSKYIQAYFYWFACEEVYTHREIHNGEVYFDVISPLEFYRVDSGARYVEDDNMCMRKYRINIHDVVDRFRDDLSSDEMEYLRKCCDVGSGVRTAHSLLNSLTDVGVRKELWGGSFGNTVYTPSNKNHIDVFHYVWKSLVKQGILKYNDINGFEQETVVDADYEMDMGRGDIEIKWEWVNQVWEGYKLGDDNRGIYTKPKPISVQREEFNNMSRCKLPYNGIVGLLNDNKRNPIPYRLLDYLTLYRIYTIQEERAINRFKSWLMFPETIMADSPNMTMEQRIEAATRDGFFPFDDADLGINSLQSIREVANGALIGYIQTLNNLKKDLKAEAFEVANMNDARFGNIAPRAGKGVTEYAFSQAMTGSVLSLEVFNLFRERDYLANLDYSKVAWFDGKQGSFVDPNTGMLKVVELSVQETFNRNIGIFIRNSHDTEAKLQELKSIAFNMSQNGNGEFALEAVTNNNVIKLKDRITKAIEKEREFNMQMEELKNQQAQQAQEAAVQLSAQEHEQAVELEQIVSDKAITVATINAESNERVVAMKLLVDTDGNGYVSKDENNAKNSASVGVGINQITN